MSFQPFQNGFNPQPSIPDIVSARLFQEYSTFEDGVMTEFNTHPFYADGICTRMTADQVRYYLLEIGFIAHNFIRWYETAKQSIADEKGKEVIRVILRSEIPRKGPTHQDDRFADLVFAGLSPQTILTAAPSEQTQETVDSLFQLIRYDEAPYFDLSVLVTLRVAGEILVAEQYKHIVAHWHMTLGLDMDDSRFFVPHMLHDQKHRGGSRGHTGAFDAVLTRLICNKEALQVAKDAAAAAERARSSIHNQFFFLAGTTSGIPGIAAESKLRKRRS